MNSATHFVTASGRVVDIFAPAARDVDFEDVAEHLCKEARYNGGTPGSFYSVAQHLVLGADYIVACAAPDPEQRKEWLTALYDAKHPSTLEDAPWLIRAPDAARLDAAYFLAHDFHEYVLKDETTPKKRALDRVAQDFGVLAGAVAEAFARLTERWDAAIHEAAGLDWPAPVETRELVDRLDKRILLAEWTALHTGHRLLGDYSAWEPLPIAVEPWSWGFAHELLSDRMARLLPVMRRGV